MSIEEVAKKLASELYYADPYPKGERANTAITIPIITDALRQREIEVQGLEPHKLINFLTVLEHQVHRNHEYRPEHCAECGLTQTISNRLREQLNLTTIRRDSEAREGGISGRQ